VLGAVPSAVTASTSATLVRSVRVTPAPNQLVGRCSPVGHSSIQRVQHRTVAQHRCTVVPATGAPWCIDYVSLADARNEEMEVAVNGAAEQRFWAKA
jgi:hypothetical protein